MKYALSLLLVSASALAAESATSIDPAARETNREIEMTYARFHYQQGEPSEAFARLQAHLLDDPADASAWDYLGQLQLAKGEVGPATASFSKAVVVAPAGEHRGTYGYHLADALVRSGKVQESKAELERVREVEVLQPAADGALLNLATGQPLPPIRFRRSGKWSASAGITAGYDTNVVLASDTNLLSTARSDVASPMISPLVTGGYAKELWKGDVTGKGYASFSYYNNSSAQNFNALAVGASADYESRAEAAYPLRYGPLLNSAFVNTSGFGFFSLSGGGHLNARTPGEGPRTSLDLPVTFDKYATAATAAADTVRTGPTVGLTGEHQRPIGPGTLSAGLGYQYHLASGDTFKSHTFNLPVQWSQPLLGKTFLTATLRGGWVSYSSSASGRSDKVLELGTQLSRPLGGKWLGIFGMKYLKNSSNDSAAQYDKFSASLMGMYEIL